jgi:hypothetical protein
MLVLLKSSYQSEIFLKIPNFNFWIVRRCNNVRLNGMYNDGSDKIVMSLNAFHFLHCIVIKNSNMEIVWTTDNPIFLRNKFDGSNRKRWCL